MPEITAIRSSKRSEGGYVISIDGKAKLTISQIMFDRLDLAVGQPVDDVLADKLEWAKQFDLARRNALQKLNRRALSSRDLKQKLRQKGYANDIIDQVVDDLIERKLLDDAQYAQMFAESQVRQKPAGKRLIVAKLRAKGIDASTADAAAGDALEGTDQLAAATQLAEKKLRTLSRVDLPTRQRRIWSLLMRRGFDSETASRAMAGLDLTGDGQDD